MSSPRWRLALAWIAGFTLIDSSIVSLALPEIARDLDRSIAELAWVATAYLLALAASLLAAGALSDRLGMRTVMIGGAVGFGLSTLACGLAPSFEALIAARVVQGVAGGVLYTTSLAITATAFPTERRATAISIYFTSGALAAVIGPVAGGLLTDLGGWRLVFFAQLPLPVMVGVMAMAVLAAGTGRPRRFDLPGVAAASLFMVATTWALLAVAEGLTPPVGIGLAVAVTALAAFIVRERRTDAPAVHLAIFSNPRFVVASVAGAGAWFGIMSSSVYPALYLQLGRELSAAESGLLLFAAPAVGLVFLPFGGRVVRRLGADLGMVIGIGLLVVSGVLMVTWGRDTPLAFVVGTGLVTGAGLAIALVASATDALGQFSAEDAGTGSAVFNSIRQLGAAMGVALPAVAYELAAAGSRTADDALRGSSAAFWLRLVVLTLPLALVLVRWRPRRAITAGVTT